jgi:molybdate transport system substrate-binding protein
VRRRSRFWIVPVVVVLGLLAAGCSDDDSGSGSSTTTSSAAKSTLSGDITVSAAASLTAAFDQIGSDFMQANPDVNVTFNPGPSSTLATQIEGGAPADVFASADETTMERLVAGGLVEGEPVVFARNRLVIVTKPGNPKNVESLADLPDAGVVALCAETVPCGRYAAEVLTKANVTIPETQVTRGTDATATIAAVTKGDADAAIVYVTDARTAGDEDAGTVTIPNPQNVIAVYPIAVMKQSGSTETAEAFIEYVLSEKGQLTLRLHGFVRPA